MEVYFNFDFLNFLRIGLLFAILLYIVFSLVVVRQVHLMTNTIKTGMTVFVRLLAYLNLAAGVIVFLFALNSL
jgi:hypothetical protein